MTSHLAKALRLAGKMEEMHATLSRLAGDKWPEHIKPWYDELDRRCHLMPQKKRLDVAQECCSLCAENGNPKAVPWIIAAYVEMVNRGAA